MKVALFILFYTLSASAYQPTVESLFRNGSNVDLGKNTAMATFILKRNIEEGDQGVHTASESSQVLKKAPSIFSYRLLFSNEGERPAMAQISYEGPSATSAMLREARYFPRISFPTMRLGDEDIEKKFFYALMASLVNNQGDLMIDFLNSVGIPAQTNKERADREQLYYLGKYAEYLKLEEQEREGKENPLEPSNPDEAEKIRQVFKRPFMTPSPYIRRTKEGPDFFWVLEASNVYAKFSHDDHKLLELRVETSAGTLVAQCFNYILYGQGMQFPELVILKDLQGDEYLLNMQKLSNFSETTEGFLKRVERYREGVNESSQAPETTFKPSLTL